MKFEEYIKIVTKTIPPEAAFNLSRDARFKAIEQILIEKGVATQEEIEAETEKQFGEIAKSIIQMPQLSKENDLESEKK